MTRSFKRAVTLIFSKVLTFTVIASATTAPIEVQNELTVWNVGQGLWVTVRTRDRCIHFDIGGESAPWRQIKDHCAQRGNEARFSHWDWDHVGLVPRAKTRLGKICIAGAPGGDTSETKRDLLKDLPVCPQAFGVQELVAPKVPGAKDGKRISSNETSRVYLSGRVLLPGDSTARQELLWGSRARLQKVEILILGHHGSQTSTSPRLLERMPRLRQAVASARKKKYGHPHMRVVRDLRLRGIALLKTEDWGSIHFLGSPSNPAEIKLGKRDIPYPAILRPAHK